MNKQCTSCDTIYDSTNHFYVRDPCNDKYFSQCKVCVCRKQMIRDKQAKRDEREEVNNTVRSLGYRVNKQ